MLNFPAHYRNLSATRGGVSWKKHRFFRCWMIYMLIKPLCSYFLESFYRGELQRCSYFPSELLIEMVPAWDWDMLGFVIYSKLLIENHAGTLSWQKNQNNETWSWIGWRHWKNRPGVVHYSIPDIFSTPSSPSHGATSQIISVTRTSRAWMLKSNTY